MKYWWILICVVWSGFVKAQVESPPSLLIGLAGLTSEKGNIDVQLLAEIISEKQSELKKEFIKREFYDKLEDKNYVVWEFAYNTLEVLLNAKNKQAIEKEMLEYAANLALVYSFTETYLQVSDQLCNSSLESVVSTWKPSATYYQQCFSCEASVNHKDTLWLSTLKHVKAGNLNSILIDLVFDILRQNKTLHKLGFFQSQLPLGEQFYATHNRYHMADGILKDKLDSLRARMETEINVLIDYYYVIKLAVEKNINLLDYEERMQYNEINNTDVGLLFEDLGRISEVINKSTQPKDIELSAKISSALGAFIDFSSRADSDAYRVEDLYYLEEVTFPLVVKLVTEYGLDSDYLGQIARYRTNILSKLLTEIKGILNQRTAGEADEESKPESRLITGLNAVDYRSFVDILKQIFELDKAGTYEDYIKSLRTVADMFIGPNESRLIFNLTDFLEKFTILDKEHNAIRVDVEEIILQLLKKYEARMQNNRVNFYFSIGLHQTMRMQYKDGYELESDSAVTLKNLSFASEKIGIKVKLRDWRRIRSFDYGEEYKPGGPRINTYNTKKPLVNDVYWLLYGSGILYNIVNTTTDSDFKYPILGTGFGISFYNSLDFNLFLSAPLVTSESLGESLKRRQILGFSFDIKLGEYITAARKKRAEQKASQ